jgi:hypothetical protein
MEQPQNKILKKLLTAIILTSFLCAGTAFAQGADTSAPAATPAADGSCESIDNPNPKSQYILNTVIEEGFSEDTPAADAAKNPDTIVKTCFRKTENRESHYVSSCTPSDTVICQRVQVIFSKGGSALLFGYISLIYKWAAGTIGIVSVLFLVWGGISIASAGDDTGKIDEAKKRIMQSITGLVLLFLSAVILYTINPNFFTL